MRLLAKNSTIIEIKLNMVVLLIAIVMKRTIAKNEKVIKQYLIHFTYCPLSNAQAVPLHPSAPTTSLQLELHLCLFLALHSVPGAFWTVEPERF